MSAAIKPWLLLIGIFVVGIVTGSALTFRLMPPRPDGDIRMHWMAFLTQQLNLTSDQRAKIKPILMDATMRIQSLHRDEVQQGSRIIRSANDQIQAVLTPEQKAQLQQLEAEREKMFLRRLRTWMPPNGNPGPGDSFRGGPPDGGPGMFNHSDRPPGPMTPPSFMETPTNVPPPPPEKS